MSSQIDTSSRSFGADLNEWIDDQPMFFSFDVFPGRSNLAILNGGAWAVERVIYNPFPGLQQNE